MTTTEMATADEGTECALDAVGRSESEGRRRTGRGGRQPESGVKVGDMWVDESGEKSGRVSPMKHMKRHFSPLSPPPTLLRFPLPLPLLDDPPPGKRGPFTCMVSPHYPSCSTLLLLVLLSFPFLFLSPVSQPPWCGRVVVADETLSSEFFAPSPLSLPRSGQNIGQQKCTNRNSNHHFTNFDFLFMCLAFCRARTRTCDPEPGGESGKPATHTEETI